VLATIRANAGHPLAKSRALDGPGQSAASSPVRRRRVDCCFKSSQGRSRSPERRLAAPQNSSGMWMQQSGREGSWLLRLARWSTLDRRVDARGASGDATASRPLLVLVASISEPERSRLFPNAAAEETSRAKSASRCLLWPNRDK
jgi:hypothetical protein